MTSPSELQRAAEAITAADALLIGAGAGMGVDSGLPDFRGPEGFWRAYPPYKKLGLHFTSLANPRWFLNDPALAWGFYGHRRNLYRATVPHDGFGILLSWARRMNAGAFVFTSNVDGHFQKAGFDPDRVVEIHGSVGWMQCMNACGIGIFAADTSEVAIDPTTMRAQAPLPTCPSCGGLARPNILMFGDWQWEEARTAAQQTRLHQWFHSVGDARLVIVECGAGAAVPTVRWFCDGQAGRSNATLIRINPREPDVPEGHIGLALEARKALHAIDRLLVWGA
jgi:NAD-dependent SIR2 family protein deacetylase